MLILNYSWAVWLAWLLAAFFAVSGILNIAGFRPMRDALLGWGYPPWFHLANGAFDFLTAATIAWYPTRPLGLLLGALLCLVIWAMLLRHRDYRHLPPSIVLFAVTVATAWGLRLI